MSFYGKKDKRNTYEFLCFQEIMLDFLWQFHVFKPNISCVIEKIDFKISPNLGSLEFL